MVKECHALSRTLSWCLIRKDEVSLYFCHFTNPLFDHKVTLMLGEFEIWLGVVRWTNVQGQAVLDYQIATLHPTNQDVSAKKCDLRVMPLNVHHNSASLSWLRFLNKSPTFLILLWPWSYIDFGKVFIDETFFCYILKAITWGLDNHLAFTE